MFNQKEHIFKINHKSVEAIFSKFPLSILPADWVGLTFLRRGASSKTEAPGSFFDGYHRNREAFFLFVQLFSRSWAGSILP